MYLSKRPNVYVYGALFEFSHGDRISLRLGRTHKAAQMHRTFAKNGRDVETSPIIVV